MLVLCLRTKDKAVDLIMKSQDILLLLKLVSLDRQLASPAPMSRVNRGIPDDWQGWMDISLVEEGDAKIAEDEVYSVRALEESTGISKSEVSGALRRCIRVGLAKADRHTGYPRTNTRALLGFILHGIKYVFPAQPGSLVRGIPTAHAAPVLMGSLLSAGEQASVWEDARGSFLGMRIEPLYKSVPHAVRRDAELYAMLALVDAIRLGQERESGLAGKRLEQYMRASSR